MVKKYFLYTFLIWFVTNTDLLAQVTSTLLNDELRIGNPSLSSATVYGYDMININGGSDQGPFITPTEFQYFSNNASASFSVQELSFTNENSITNFIKDNNFGFSFLSNNGDEHRLKFDFFSNPIQLQVNYAFDGSSVAFGNFMTLDYNSLSVGIEEYNPLATLHIKQIGTNEEGLAIENADAGSDIYAWEIGGNDLHLYYDANGPTGGESYIDRAQIEDTDGSWVPTPNAVFTQNAKQLKTGVLGKVLQFKPCTYRFKRVEGDVRKTFGFIAQEVKAIYPELANLTEKGYYTLNYQAFSVVAIKAIQEQQVLFDKQSKKLQQVKQERAQLKSELIAMLEKLEN